MICFHFSVTLDWNLVGSMSTMYPPWTLCILKNIATGRVSQDQFLFCVFHTQSKKETELPYFCSGHQHIMIAILNLYVKL
jgi:hypothetical protein